MQLTQRMLECLGRWDRTLPSNRRIAIDPRTIRRHAKRSYIAHFKISFLRCALHRATKRHTAEVHSEIGMCRFPTVQKALRIFRNPNAQMRVFATTARRGPEPCQLRMPHVGCPREAHLWRTDIPTKIIVKLINLRPLMANGNLFDVAKIGPNALPKTGYVIVFNYS